MSEEWRPIPGWAPAYEASSLGRVRSTDRVVTHSTGVSHRLSGRILAQTSHAGGYLMLSLCAGGVDHKRHVHRLVAEAFHGLPSLEKPVVLHLDGNKFNNASENLRWGTNSENSHQRVRDGRDVHALRTHCPRNHDLSEPNLVAGDRKRGLRNCLACNRTRSRQKNLRKRSGNNFDFDFQATSDDYYRKIMENA